MNSDGQLNLDSDHVFSYIIIVIKNKLSLQTVKILMRRLIREPSHHDFHCLPLYVRIYMMSEVTRLYPI